MRAIIFAITGVLFVAGAIGIVRGKLTGFDRLYFNPELPAFVRHGVFALLPFGLALLAGALLVGPLADADLRVRVVAALAGLVWGSLAIVALVRPPSLLKPEWLKSRERAMDPLTSDSFDRAVAAALITSVAVSCGAMLFLGFATVLGFAK